MEVKPLDEFPLEVLENIFGYCEVGSLKQLIMSCNSFYEIIVRSKELHTKLTLIINELDCAINSANYKRLIENNRVFLKLVVFPSRFDGECLKTLVEYIEIFGQNIKEVTFRKENTNPRLLMRTIYKTFELMPNLEKITFEGNGWILRSGSINQPLLPFDFLRELHLKRDGRYVHCEFSDFSNIFDGVTGLVTVKFDGAMSRNCLNMLHNNRSALKNLIISGSLHTQIHPHHLNTVSLERFCVCPRNFGGESALAVFLRTQRELKELTIMHPQNSNDLVSAIMGHPSLETFELIMGKEWFYKDIQRLSNSKITTLKLQIKQASSVQQAKMVSTSFLKLERLELNLHETRTFAGMNDERHTDISVDFNLHPSLQYISVCMENLTYEGLRQLRMDKLKKFEWRYNKYKVTIDWDAFAQKNPNIEEFYLKGIPLTNIDLEHITRNLKNLQVFEYDPSNNSTEWEMQYVLNVKSLPIILNNCLNLRLLKMKLKKLINPSTANPVYSTWSYGQGNKDDIALLELQPRLDKLESYEFTLDGKIKNREYFNKD